MTDKPGFFRKAIEQIIEGRQLRAQRFVATYLRERGVDLPKSD